MSEHEVEVMGRCPPPGRGGTERLNKYYLEMFDVSSDAI
jgi:hypothetical protein